MKWSFSKWMLIGIFILLIIVSSLSSKNFLQLSNITNILRQSSILGILAVGETLVILTGGIDLSVGSLLALSCIMSGICMPLGMGPAIIAAVGSATLMGLFSGFLVGKINLPPFIATIGMMGIAQGIALTASNAEQFKIMNDHFNLISYGNLGPFPIPFLIWMILCFLVFYLTKFRKNGRYLYAVGSNEQAARVAGINLTRIKMMVYSISGFTAGIAGVIAAARLNAGTPNIGEGYDMTTISAVVIGGISLLGGEGTISGSLLGALILGLIANYMNLVGINPYFQDVVKGLIILIAVYVYFYGSQRRKVSLAVGGKA